MPGAERSAGLKPAGQPRRTRSRRPGASPRKPTAVDRHVGRRLRLLRQINDVSLERLAELVDVAPQQIQKYEIGETRISASRIFELSKIFGVQITWFYDDLNATTSAQLRARMNGHRSLEAGEEGASDASEELLLSYYRQLKPQMQGKLIDIARMLSELSPEQAR